MAKDAFKAASKRVIQKAGIATSHAIPFEGAITIT